MRSFFQIALSIFVLFSLQSCQMLSTSGTGYGLDHNLDTLPLRTEGFLWTDVSRDQFLNDVAPTLLISASKEDVVPESDERLILIQNIMDGIHEGVLVRYPVFKAIPRPKAILFKDSSPNAFVEKINVCLPTSVKLSGGSEKPEFENAVRLTNNGNLADVETCIKLGVSNPQKYLEFTNSLSHGCKLEFKDGVIELGEQCSVNRYFDRFSKSPSFAFSTVSSFIVFTTGLFETFSGEEELTFTIAHELSHYYRLHPLLPENDFKAYYQLEPTFGNGCPKRATREEVELVGVSSDKLQQVLSDKKLGLHTYEQEADEFALELMGYFNVPTEFASSALLNMLKKVEVRGEELGYDACKALKDSDWKDIHGHPVYVPLGNLRSAHRSLCFRLYNVDNERKAHCFD